jgi:hypothetical protein
MSVDFVSNFICFVTQSVVVSRGADNHLSTHQTRVKFSLQASKNKNSLTNLASIFFAPFTGSSSPNPELFSDLASKISSLLVGLTSV